MDSSTEVKLGMRHLDSHVQPAKVVIPWPVPDPLRQPRIDTPQYPHGPLKPAGMAGAPFEAKAFTKMLRQQAGCEEACQRHCEPKDPRAAHRIEQIPGNPQRLVVRPESAHA